MGWYKGLPAAVSGLNFRWHEVPRNSGTYEGYGLAFLLYTYDPALGGCGVGYDLIPNSIKPPGQAGKLLLVLWEQRVEGGVERRRWLAYSVMGTPAIFPNPRAGADIKVVGAQDNVDGLLNDDTSLYLRVREKFVNGRRVNDLQVLYGDSSPYYPHGDNAVCVDITRKRVPPEWIDPAMFPVWASNRFDTFACGSNDILNFWYPDPCRTSDPGAYDFYTLMIQSGQIGLGNPPATVCGANPVQWVINPLVASDLLSPPDDPNIDSGGGLVNPDRVSVFPDRGTIRTYKFILDDFGRQAPEIGLHGMGNLNDSNRIVAFDDWAIQYLGRSECP